MSKDTSSARRVFCESLADLLAPRGQYVVVLGSVGNPDFGQDSRRSLPGVPRLNVRVATLRHASEACRMYISRFELGGGNWNGGQVYLVPADASTRPRCFRGTESEPMIAQISYNGRAWHADPSKHPSPEIALDGDSREERLKIVAAEATRLADRAGAAANLPGANYPRTFSARPGCSYIDLTAEERANLNPDIYRRCQNIGRRMQDASEAHRVAADAHEAAGNAKEARDHRAESTRRANLAHCWLGDVPASQVAA